MLIGRSVSFNLLRPVLNLKRRRCIALFANKGPAVVMWLQLLFPDRMAARYFLAIALTAVSSLRRVPANR